VFRLFSIRVVKAGSTWVWYDYAGWGPGQTKTKFGAYFLAFMGKTKT
jgi:hypothetical protein